MLKNIEGFDLIMLPRAVEDSSVTVDVAANKFNTVLGNDLPCLCTCALINGCNHMEVLCCRIEGLN